jgi:hypothetical protein
VIDVDLRVTILFYGLIGLGVAITGLVRDRATSVRDFVSQFVARLAFWPIFLPILLADLPPSPTVAPRSEQPSDALSRSISQVEAELDLALEDLDGWAEEALARERERINELKAAWRSQADRIRDMDRLLAQTTTAMLSPDPAADSSSREPQPIDVRVNQSEQARLENLERIRAIRRQANADLMATLAWVRELVSMIHLAKFTGASATRTHELVAQIAAAVEGLSEVTNWRDETGPTTALELASARTFSIDRS